MGQKRDRKDPKRYRKDPKRGRNGTAKEAQNSYFSYKLESAEKPDGIEANEMAARDCFVVISPQEQRNRTKAEDGRKLCESL